MTPELAPTFQAVIVPAKRNNNSLQKKRSANNLVFWPYF